MVLRRLRRTEEGQVYPALLLAVIGGFAIALSFVGLQNLVDQTGRAASASDAAALAVGQAHRDNVVQALAGDPAAHLGQLLSFLQTVGAAPAADQVAGQYAAANGAEVEGQVRYVGFDTGRREWVYEVSTLQSDTVEGGTGSTRSESASRVAVAITGGLCPDFRGIEVDGTCIDAQKYGEDCVAPPPPPPPPPVKPVKPGKPADPPAPSDPPSEAPPFQAKGYCGAGLAQSLHWKTHLVN